jgi:hypothetical protein
MSASLAEVQALFQRGILDGDDTAMTLVRRPPRDSSEVMFGVYRNAYSLRLVEFLQNDFEKLSIYMGQDRFGAMSRDYVKAHRSDTPNARWYSRHLPEFLASDPRYRDEPQLRDLAELERAVNDAFDAPNSPTVSLGELALIGAECIAMARFQASPSVRRLSVTTTVADMWPALLADAPVPAAQMLDAAAEILVWRQNESSHFRVIDSEEAMAFDEMRNGVPFGVLCEMIAVMGDPDSAALRAAGYLRSWIESTIIAAIEP